MNKAELDTITLAHLDEIMDNIDATLDAQLLIK